MQGENIVISGEQIQIDMLYVQHKTFLKKVRRCSKIKFTNFGMGFCDDFCSN